MHHCHDLEYATEKVNKLNALELEKPAGQHTFGRLLLDIRAGQIPVHQGRLAAGQVTHDPLKHRIG